MSGLPHEIRLPHDGFTITRDTTVHTPGGTLPARWTWHPDCPVSVRLVVDHPQGHDVLSYGRAGLYRLLALGAQPLDPVYQPESAAWVDRSNWPGWLWCQLAPHTTPECPGPRTVTRTLLLRTSSTRAGEFLAATFQAMPACVHQHHRYPAYRHCQESQQTQKWVTGLAEQILTEARS